MTSPSMADHLRTELVLNALDMAAPPEEWLGDDPSAPQRLWVESLLERARGRGTAGELCPNVVALVAWALAGPLVGVSQVPSDSCLLGDLGSAALAAWVRCGTSLRTRRTDTRSGVRAGRCESRRVGPGAVSHSPSPLRLVSRRAGRKGSDRSISRGLRRGTRMPRRGDVSMARSAKALASRVPLPC